MYLVTTLAPDSDGVRNSQAALVSHEEFELLVAAGAFLEYSRGRSAETNDSLTKSDSSTARSLLSQCPPLRPPDAALSPSGTLLEHSGLTFDAIDLVIASGRVPVLALRPQVPYSVAL